MSTEPFYKQIHSLHAALEPDQLKSLGAFLERYKVFEIYEGMVDPPGSTEEERDAEAITRGFAISQQVPDEAWAEFETILGPVLYAQFVTAIDAVKAKFVGLFE